jgi:hypothetical protein
VASPMLANLYMNRLLNPKTAVGGST